LAASARDTIDLQPAYAAIVFGLKDGHSTIRPAKAIQDGWVARYGQRRLLPDEPPRPRPQSAYSSRTEVAGHVITLSGGRQITHLVAPAVEWTEGVASAPYGNKLFMAVLGGSSRSCGFVVDLRGNSGGDVFPMISGLSPLIGDGQMFRMQDRAGTIQASMLKGAAVVGIGPDGQETEINRVTGWQWLPMLSTSPVAVLTDSVTASSGEIAALAFRGRQNTRFFGEKTRGLASGNDFVELQDGVTLLITSAMALDRNGRTYPNGIEPDEVILAANGQDEPVLAAATRWLAADQGCVSGSN
jgi:hypothetical protein